MRVSVPNRESTMCLRTTPMGGVGKDPRETTFRTSTLPGPTDKVGPGTGRDRKGGIGEHVV